MKNKSIWNVHACYCAVKPTRSANTHATVKKVDGLHHRAKLYTQSLILLACISPKQFVHISTRLEKEAQAT